MIRTTLPAFAPIEAAELQNNTMAVGAPKASPPIDVPGKAPPPRAQGASSMSAEKSSEQALLALARVLGEVENLHATVQALPADSAGNLGQLKSMIKKIAGLNDTAFALKESLVRRAWVLQQDVFSRPAAGSPSAHWLADGDGLCTGAEVARWAARRPSLELDTALRHAQYQAGRAEGIFEQIQDISRHAFNDTAV